MEGELQDFYLFSIYLSKQLTNSGLETDHLIGNQMKLL